MRVLLVTALVGGGVGAHVRQLAAGLVGRGHEVAVACPAEVARRFELAGVGARVLPVELGHRVRPGADHTSRRRLREAMSGVDVVHAHGMRAGAAAALARPRHGPGLVVTSHNGPPSGGAGMVYELLERVVCRRADLVLGVSPDLVERAARRGAPATGPAVVPAEVSPLGPGEHRAARYGLRAELGLQDGQLLVLTVGRLAPQKRTEAAVRAYQRVVGDHPTTVLAVAGEGPEAARLHELADTGPGQVRWLGHRADVPALLAAADVVLSSARWEGQPLVLQEALAAGAPVLATDVGGTAVVLGGAGRLVPGGDDGQVADDLAAALGELLADPAARAELARRAWARAAELPDGADAVDAVLSCYQQVLAARDDG